MSGAEAKVWTLGKTWQVHARNEDCGCWIRRSGIAYEHEAIWEADALVNELNRPHPHLTTSSTPPESASAGGGDPDEGAVLSRESPA